MAKHENQKGFAPVAKKLFVNGDIPVPQHYLDRIGSTVHLQGNVFGKKYIEKDSYAVLDARIGAGVIVDINDVHGTANPSIEYLVKNYKMRSARWTHGFPITEIDLSKIEEESPMANQKPRFFKLTETNPKGWGWDKNPEINVPYSLEELEKMYGSGWTDGIISTWEDHDWEPSHGKWVAVDRKEVSNG